MIHTRKELLSKTLSQIKNQEHQCCTEAAATDWISIIHSEEHMEFFMSVLNQAKNDGESELDTYMKILSLGLMLGSVCALGQVSIMHSLVEHHLKAALGDFMPSFPKKPKDIV